MKIKYYKQFKKHFKERIPINSSLHQRFNERVRLFLDNPKNPILQDHKLTGKIHRYRAFSITGDIRLIYYKSEYFIYFIDIGTHNQVY